MKHIMMLTLMGGKLHFAPIAKDPGHIIDLGTGTGMWVIDSTSVPPQSVVGYC
jgi:methylase of polypeptide subunit release factors